MTTASVLIDELARAMEGDAWHGDPIARILDGVTVEDARARPVPAAHSIVRHMTAWTGEVARRLAGHPAGEPLDGDWPPPSGDEQSAWHRDVTKLFEAHQRVIAMLESFTDEQLHAVATDPRERSTGAGVTHEVLLHGLAQHHAYHGGQIALLKRALATNKRA